MPSPSTSSRSTNMMIKLAPSPRDVPAVKLASPRSFRSQNSSQRSPSQRALSPRGGGGGGGGGGKQRNIVEAAAMSPEISTNVVISKNKQQQVASPKNNGSARQLQRQGSASGANNPAVSASNPTSPTTVNAVSTSKMAAGTGASAGAAVGTAPTSSYSAAPTTIMVNEQPYSPSNPTSPTNTSAAVGSPSSKPNTAMQSLPTTRSKRMLVVDPNSGKKVFLHADDHSLTDKELHVYHKSKKSQQRAARLKEQELAAAAAASALAAANTHHRRQYSERSLSISDSTQHTATTNETGTQATLNTLNTDDHTLETASALTEVSYYGRYKLHSGPFECIMPTSCRSIKQMALGDLMYPHVDDEGEHDRMAREGRDDVESVERGRYKHLLEEHGKADDATGPKRGLKVDSANENNHSDDDQACLSPITQALNSLVSPRISTLVKSFFDTHNARQHNSNNIHTHETSSTAGKTVEVKFRRICLVVFPNEVTQSLRGKLQHGRAVGLLGMKFHQSGSDFQAHVAYVQRGSKAERMGVRKGDTVSFAVALSNMTEEQNSFLAEKLIKRLESVGMRTSYRELYDIFLSKTTNGRPIGMVFRRWKSRHSPDNVASAMALSPTNGMNNGSGSGRITDEFEWSTDFLQSLSIKCREYEFEQKVPLSLDEHHNAESSSPKNDKNYETLLSFLPKPNVETTPSNGIVADYLTGLLGSLATKYNCATALPMMKCIETTLGVTPAHDSSTATREQAQKEDFLSNRILCSLVEQSMGLIFLRRVVATVSNQATGQGNNDKKVSGSGFAVIRKAEGSWSAPCFLSILGSKDKFTDTCDNEKSSSESSNDDDVKMIVIRKKELVNNLILGNAVKFSVRKEERANVLVRDAAIIGVSEGRFQLASDFFLAVKVNDVQNQGAYSLSTDHIEASDILTGTISPPEQSVDFYGALQSLELPYSMHSHPVIPDMLQRYSDSDWCEFLPDHESTAESSCGMRTKLQMISQRNSSLEDRREIDIFARKFKYYLMDGVPVHRILSSSSNGNHSGLTEEKVLRLTIKDPQSLFSSSLELIRKRRPGLSNVGIPSNFSTSFENVTKLSRTPPAALTNLDEEEKKRFFSIETDLSPGPVMMLAKSKKDAMILLCGLKLLLEREKMLSY